MEIASILALVQAVGPLGAAALIVAWWLSQRRESRRNAHNPSEYKLLVEIREELRALRLRLEDVWQEVHHAASYDRG